MDINPDTSKKHPHSGFHYIHVITDEWGPFVDVRSTLESVANRTEWMSVIRPGRFCGMMDASKEKQDSGVMFIDWTSSNPVIPEKHKRNCIVAVAYIESVGDGSKMLKQHVLHWEAFKKNGHLYDAVFVPTPMRLKKVEKSGVSTYLYPLGWDAYSSGLPNFYACKHRGYIFYGSMAGKRELIFPFLKKKLCNRLEFVSGNFGRSLQGILDESKASLHIAHSDVESFPQWRLWQTVSTSAALVTEQADIWPMEAGRHCLVINRVTAHNAEETVQELNNIMMTKDLISVAKTCHDEIGSNFTAEKCIDRYLVPASLEILKDK